MFFCKYNIKFFKNQEVFFAIFVARVIVKWYYIIGYICVLCKRGEGMTKKQIALAAVNALKIKYPEAKCSLNADTPFQLLVATRLSAQCTDARVNIVTPELFKMFPTPKDFANAEISKIEEAIKSCGLYKTKARDLKNLGVVLTETYGGELPKTLEELIKLPGIGRKTANLICGDVYGMPAVVADTHCIRIAGRLGLTDSTDPKKVELELKKILPENESNDFCHRIVLHGRDTCKAPTPKCDECCLSDFCPKKIKKKGNNKK